MITKARRRRKDWSEIN